MASSIHVLPDRYASPRLVGSGGMGQIFRATDTQLRRDVAVKVLADRYAADEEIRARFRREALMAARLSGNPNIVTLFDVQEFRGRPMIVMEYLEGGSLEARLHGHPGCPPGQVLDWLEQAANALDDAHAAGVVHRDVKPANLLLDRRDQVHVADFGIARAVGLDSSTKTGTVLGTAGYLSPEQARGERATAASDRYSLAVVAFELLAGTRPFASDSQTVEAARHVTEPVPSIHELKPELPSTLDGVFERALAKSPAARHASAAEFVAELRAALHSDAGRTESIAPVWPSALTSVIAPAPSVSPPRDPAPTPRRGPRRPVVMLLLLVALAAGGLAAALASSRGGSPRSVTSNRRPRPVTVVRTITEPGRTVEQTVTAPAPPPATTTTSVSTPATTAPTTTAVSGTVLNDEGYARMRAGDYAAALPLLEQAVQQLSGTGSLSEAYADYNLAYTRYELGQCSDVLSLLDHSQAIQGRRTQIDALRRDARKACH